MTFDSVIIVDWSGGNDRGANPKADAIWACASDGEPVYLRNRQLAEMWLQDAIEDALIRGIRLMIGFDFPFGYPQGFSAAICGSDDPIALWAWFNEQINDTPQMNNRFDLAGQVNAQFDGVGPFWGNGLRRDIDHLPRLGRARTSAHFPERRAVEQVAKGSFSCWQMSGVGSVGGQVMMGLPVLHRLRNQFSKAVSVWPFEDPMRPITFAEVWPSLVAGPAPNGMIKDAHQARATSRYFDGLNAHDLANLMKLRTPTQEGWILGVPPATLVE